jgi:hypothetical protein
MSTGTIDKMKGWVKEAAGALALVVALGAATSVATSAYARGGHMTPCRRPCKRSIERDFQKCKKTCPKARATRRACHQPCIVEKEGRLAACRAATKPTPPVCGQTTTTVPGQRQAPVPLGSASNFAVLAGSTVTNTGATTVTGNLGVSPGAAVTGFPPGTVNGTIHAGDPAAAQAILDLTTAFNDAAGRSTAPVSVSGNVGGQTLPPGLYKSTSSLAISSGDLTLDAQGDANAVFIFQMASTLTTTSGRQVILSGDAKASNVFWQVGSSATLGTTSVFKGNILADQSITLDTGATLDGRALTRIGAVTLDTDTVTNPAP